MKCKRCNRTLTAPKSVERGTGDRCAKLDAMDAALTRFSRRQLSKADDLIVDNAMIRSARRPMFFTAVSDDGTETHLVHPNGCTCEAGRRQVRCYHRAAAITLLALAS